MPAQLNIDYRLQFVIVYFKYSSYLDTKELQKSFLHQGGYYP